MSRSIVIVTRPEGDSFSQALSQRGIDSIDLPLFTVRALELNAEDSKVLSALESFSWLIFTSQHGVRFAHRLISQPIPFSLKIAVIGEKTARIFSDCFHRRADFVGAGDCSENFASIFLASRMQTEKLLLLNAREHRGVIPKRAFERAIPITVLPLYEQNPLAVSQELLHLIKSKSAKDLIWPFFSPSAVRRCAELGAEIFSLLKIGKVLTIGAVTTAALAEAGISQVIESTTHTEEGMLDLISTIEAR